MTDRERLINELTRLNLLFEDSSEAAKVGGWEIDLENDTIAFTNETFDIYELPRGELPSMDEGIGYYHPEHQQLIRDAVTNAIENNQHYDLDVKLITAKNNEIWVNTKGRTTLKKGKVIRLYGSIQDITDKKNAEIELKKAQEIAKLGSWYLNTTTGEVSWSEELYKMYGFDPNEPIPPYEEHAKFMTHESWKLLNSSIANTAKTGEPYTLELKTIKNEGDWQWMYAEGEAIFNSKKEIIGLRGIAQDITSRKLAEEKIKESERSISSLLNSFEDIVCVIDDNGNILKVNDAWVEFGQRNDNDISAIGHTKFNYFDACDPDAMDEHAIAVFEGLKEIIKGNKKQFSYEYPCHGLDKKQWFLMRATLMKTRKKQVAISHIDVTERKEAQLALVESEKRFQHISNNLVGAILQYVLRPDGSDAIPYMSSSCYELWEVDANTVIEDVNILWDMVHPDYVPLFYESIQKSAELLEPWFFEWQIITPSGKHKWLEGTGRPEKMDNGDMLWDVIIMDVTQRKIAEMNFQESEERFKAFMENIPAFIFIKDKQLRHVYGNKRMLDLFGKSTDEYKGTTAHDFLDSHVASELDKADMEVLKAKKKVEIEIPINRDGIDMWIRDIKFPIELPSGEIYIGGLVFDITNKKQDELALKDALNQVTELKNKYEKENIYLKEEIGLAFNYKDMIYASDEISEVLNQVDMVAGTDATVLLQGETGTGKEIVARAIHSNSLKSENPFIKINCAAIPRELIESELFGHKKGSFTGAICDRVGKFELANGGTLFLDEIGELPIEMQPKLLRVLQEGEIEPIGGSKIVKVDVRIVAATNRNLLEEIENGNFREDLYFRLNVFPINIPPLRERKKDIPVLINHFVTKFSDQYRKELKHILKDDLQAMMNYDWPGNVRELENFIERSVIVSQGDYISFNLGTKNDDSEKRAIKSIGKTLDDVQREHITQTLIATKWKIAGADGAAAILDIKPSTLRDRMKKLNIQKP